MKVLIAEDNPIWRQMLKQNVSNWGYEPVVAEDGKEAWKILQRPDAPRLAVLDWQMPHMDGIDVCRHIKGCQTLPFGPAPSLITCRRPQKFNKPLGSWCWAALAQEYLKYLMLQ